MNETICIEFELPNQETAITEFPKMQKTFIDGIKKQPAAKLLKPQISRQENKIFIELKTPSPIIAGMILPLIETQMKTEVAKEMEKNGYCVKTRCYQK